MPTIAEYGVWLVNELPATSLGNPRRHFQVVDSTNRVARQLADAGATHGTMVTAAEQSAGRGRQGRPWSAPPGSSLLVSLVVRDPSPLLSLVAGVAVAETVDQVVKPLHGAAPAGDQRSRQAQIKWPNDVMLDRRKVAGILVEGRPQQRWGVLGIGLNVAVQPADLPPELRARAGTLGLTPDAVEAVLQRLLAALERWLAASDAEVLAMLDERDYLRGRELTWQTTTGEASGTAVGIGSGGGLLARLADGTVTTIEAGEVHIGTV